MNRQQGVSSRVFARVAVAVLAALVAGAAAGCGGARVTDGTQGATATPSQLATPTTVATSIEGVSIRYVQASQAELILVSGRHVFIDVGYPYALGSKPTPEDILLTSQGRPHHYDAAFADAFPGQKLVMLSGRIDLEDVHVRTIESSDSDGPFAPGEGNNQMFVIETAGVRILHCGDLDQLSMTPDQLAALAKIDVAICPIKDPSGDDPSGVKAIDLLAQINPRLVIPTDVDMETARNAVGRWSASYTTKPAVTVLRRQLPADTTVLFLGAQAKNYGVVLGLTESTW